MRGVDDDRRVRELAVVLQPFDDREAVEVGEHEIENDHARHDLAAQCDRFASGDCVTRLNAARMQRCRDHARQIDIIFDDEDHRLFAHRLHRLHDLRVIARLVDPAGDQIRVIVE